MKKYRCSAAFSRKWRMGSRAAVWGFTIFALMFGMALASCGDVEDGGNSAPPAATEDTKPGGDDTGDSTDTGGDSTETTAKPGKPTGVEATTVSSSKIKVSWKEVDGATSYNVYTSLSDSGTYTSAGTVTTTSATITSLTADTTYYFKVSAVNSVGESAKSSSVSAKTQQASGSGVTVPAAPTGVRATALSSSEVRVEWIEVSNATSYKVYCVIDGEDRLDGTVTTNSFTSTGWQANDVARFKVTAVNSAGESAFSTVAWTILPEGSGANGSVKIVNNSGRTIQNLVFYQEGHYLLDGVYSFFTTITNGSEATWTNAPAGSYVEIGSQPYSNYTVKKDYSFTVTAGQTTTVIINASDVIPSN